MKPRRFASTSGIVITDRGSALCATWNFACAAWQESFERLPLSVEMWAKPKIGKERLFTCVYPREIAAQIGVTAWGMTVGSGGDLAAFICGDKTRWIWNNQRILGEKWHHLAARFDGKDIALYLDGNEFKQDELSNNESLDLPDAGLHIGWPGAIACEAMIQEVRISRGPRTPSPGFGRMSVDEATLALWRFDEAERNCVLDLSGRSGEVTIHSHPRESLDAAERREYQAGPAPLDVPAQLAWLVPGKIAHASGPEVLNLDGLWEMSEGDASLPPLVRIMHKQRNCVAQTTLTPSPGTPGEGVGEGIRATGATNELVSDKQEYPHPNPLPEYRARGPELMHNPHQGRTKFPEHFIPAQVPGSVHAALVAAEKIPDPTFGLNEVIAREQSFKTWWFRKCFTRPKSEKHRLVFGGVAVHCTVWLNGEQLGEHEGMFGGPDFDISQLLQDENELVVKINPAPQGPPGFAITSNDGWRKTVVFNNVYGWHYCNIPALGIWRSVEVRATPTVQIVHPFIITRSAEHGEISLRLDLHGPPSGWRGELLGTIEPENFAGDSSHFSHEICCDTSSHQLHLQMHIADPCLWWPNDLGEANLYRLTLSFQPDKGQSDFFTTTFGLRTIEMKPLPGGERPAMYNWTFVINGRPTFLKGAGWCTMDALMDFRRERYEHFLQLAKDQHCQMLRAWGSGMPETDDFYDLCDRLGITVMQEWPTAWNSHEQQPHDVLEETVRLNTLRLRNHPSLLIWTGGNESSNPKGKAINMMGRLAIELDNTRPFHRGEPWGGSDHNYACWWARAHLDTNLRMTSPFIGEFGIASMPVLESVRKYLPEEERELWPPKENGAFTHHTPVFNTMQDMDRLRQYASGFSAGASMEGFIIASQIAQVVAVRHTLERARTRWPESVGALMYKLNDNYPGASWSTIDWYGATKISYWFVQDAFAPLHVCLLFETVNNVARDVSLPIFLLDDADALKNVPWRVEVRAYNSGLRLIKAVEFFGRGSIQGVCTLGDFSLTAQQTNTVPLLLVAELHRDGTIADRTFYFINYEAKPDCLFELPDTTLDLNVINHDAIITNTGTIPAVAASIERPGHRANFRASDNCFWLEPGESRIIHVSHADALQAAAWNVRE